MQLLANSMDSLQLKWNHRHHVVFPWLCMYKNFYHDYLAAEHRRDFGCFIIQTDLPHRWTLVRFRLLHYTDRITLPLNIGEISVASLYRQNYLAATSPAYESSIHILRTWCNFCGSVYIYIYILKESHNLWLSERCPETCFSECHCKICSLLNKR